MATSENPNETAGRARAGNTTLSYPLNETLTAGTRLRFVKYSRFSPGDEATEDTEATINLPLPINVPENYSISTTSEGLGKWGNINDANVNMIRGLDFSDTNLSNSLAEMAESGVATAISNIRSGGFNVRNVITGLGAITKNEEHARAIQSFTGLVVNPHITTMFDGVGLRQISLEWRFSPRSEDESEALKRIFDTIKLRIHPEELANGYALNYPDLVYIEFTGKAEEYFPKFSKAMVNSIHITPEANGSVPMFKSGAPIGYNFQIVAQELSIQTRNTLMKNGVGG